MRRLIIITLLLIVTIFSSVNLGKQLQLAAMRDTYTVCMAGHRDTDGTKEQACADAQNKTSTEFICNKTGNYCWLEVK